MRMKPKIIRACTVSMSVDFVTGILPELQKKYELALEENDRLRDALIRIHDMYDSYYKKEGEVQHDGHKYSS